MKVFLDANVLFSASLSATGVGQALLVAAQKAGAGCISSEFAFGEARRNLGSKAPMSLRNLELIEEIVLQVPEPGPAAVAAARDAGVVVKDAPVLAAALAGGADWFVTGDVRHFGHLFGQRVQGVLVLSLRAAVDALSAKAPQRAARGRAK